MTALDVRARPIGRVVSPVTVGLAALGACAVVAAVDPNEPGHYPTCPFKLLTGLDCPGCGTLRAIHALTRGDLLLAVDHNLLTVLFLPVLMWAWLGWWRYRRGERSTPPALPGRAALAVPVVVGLFWLVRNLPVEPLTWLASTAA